MKFSLSRISIAAVFCATAVITTGCMSFVKVTPEGERIAVANLANVSHCKKVASVTVNGRDNYVGSMKRNANKVSSELTSLARNQAASTEGNTIVAAGGVVNGSQNFDVYRCPN
jgi:hypothetical protein